MQRMDRAERRRRRARVIRRRRAVWERRYLGLGAFPNDQAGRYDAQRTAWAFGRWARLDIDGDDLRLWRRQQRRRLNRSEEAFPLLGVAKTLPPRLGRD